MISPVVSSLLAYVDPGSGSVLIQLVIGAVAGALVAVRLYWTRLKAFVAGRSRTKENDGADHES